MNLLDIILLIILLLGLWKGLLNGFFVELASLIALIAAIYGSIYFSNYAGDYLRTQLDWDETYITIASFIITFLVIIFTISFIGKVFTKAVNTARLGTINKLAGGVFGLLKIGFIASVLLMFIDTASEEIDLLGNTRDESFVYPYIAPIAPAVLPTLLEEAERIDRELRGDEDSTAPEN